MGLRDPKKVLLNIWKGVLVSWWWLALRLRDPKKGFLSDEIFYVGHNPKVLSLDIEARDETCVELTGSKERASELFWN